jgi:hypothetical protein
MGKKLSLGVENHGIRGQGVCGYVVVGGARREKNKRISGKRQPVWLPIAH